MKKVIAINSSKRKKNTYKLLVEIKELLSRKNIEVEIITLSDFSIKTCVGCEACVLTNQCVLQDDMNLLMDKLQSADGIIISSPVYLRQVTGSLKTFVDRTCSWFHRPPLFKKPLLAVSTTKGSGLKSTLSYIEEIGEQWGMMRAGSIGRNVRNIDVPVSQHKLNRFIHLLNSPSSYSPTFQELLNFQVQKAMSNHIIELDNTYWTKQNWKKQSYYFPCQVNGLKAMLPIFIGKQIDKAMGKANIKYRKSNQATEERTNSN